MGFAAFLPLLLVSGGLGALSWSSFGGSVSHTGFYSAPSRFPLGPPVTFGSFDFQAPFSTAVSDAPDVWYAPYEFGYQQLFSNFSSGSQQQVGWFQAVPISNILDALGGSSAPTVSDGVLFGQVCNCTQENPDLYSNFLVAVNCTTGDLLWHSPLVQDAGLCVMDRTYSPLVLSSVVMMQTSGSLFGVDRWTGALLWNVSDFAQGGRPSAYVDAHGKELMVLLWGTSFVAMDPASGRTVRSLPLPFMTEPAFVVKNPVVDQSRSLAVLASIPWYAGNVDFCDQNVTVIDLQGFRVLWHNDFCVSLPSADYQYQDWTPTLALDTGELYVPVQSGIHVRNVLTGKELGKIVFPPVQGQGPLGLCSPSRYLPFNCVASQPIATTTHLLVPLDTGYVTGFAAIDRQSLNMTYINLQPFGTNVVPFLSLAFGKLFVTALNGDPLAGVFTLQQ